MDAPIYSFLSVAAALFVLRDTTRCTAPRVGWMVASALAWPIAVPVWLATRPLRSGEHRSGGRAWKMLRYFALAWTILWGAQTLVTLGVGAVVAGTARSQADRASGLGMMRLMASIHGVLWFFPALGALLLGLALRKPAVVEHGLDARTWRPDQPRAV
jgi:hypothetical protein